MMDLAVVWVAMSCSWNCLHLQPYLKYHNLRTFENLDKPIPNFKKFGLKAGGEQQCHDSRRQLHVCNCSQLYFQQQEPGKLSNNDIRAEVGS